ncbi:hypothetical protein LK540_10280 [Massilia sp. IC2-278]|uniref:hypothetical protein n=1 Tax=Massilia sp. IC2-278 TaxID=2887200 RepID=UPI001E48A1D9|nr:hypothetical protein [Massilia sp. IC2-278]MCC2960812.1 hypothetical protein [Massilia sp. IC2-278]
MNLLLRVFPGISSAWMILALLGALALWGWTRGGLADSDRKTTACMLLFAVGMLCWRLSGQASMAALVPMEGTGNADELWYIFTADWLRTHSLAAAFPSDPAYPLSAAAGVNLGLLPRIGAESLLVLFSGISGMPLEQVYPVLFALGAVLFGFAASQGFLQEARNDWKFLALALLAVALSPVALFIYGNENFATMWGLVFLAGYYWNVQQALADGGGRGNMLAAGIFLGALLATYPELLAIAGPASVLLYLQVAVRKRALSLSSIHILVLCAVVAAFAAPFAALATIKVLATGASAAQGPNVIFPTLFADMTPANLLLTLLAFDTKVMALRLGGSGVLLGGIVLAAALLFAPRRVWLGTGALALACLPVFAMFWRSHYGYGGMKAIEFMALPVATLLGAAAGSAAPALRALAMRASPGAGPSGRAVLRHGAHGVCIALALLVLGTISFERWREFRQHGAQAHFSAELRELGAARAALPPGAVLLVGPELGKHSFLFSRWVAYVLRDVPLVFPPELHNGGYIYRLEADYDARRETVTHVLKARSGEGALSNVAIWHNAAFEIVPADRIPFRLGEGFHGHEDWGRWMAASARIELRGDCARTLKIHVGRRFEPIKGEDALIVSAGDVSARFPLNNGQGEISFTIPAGASHVELRSAAGGLSPASVGASDDRVLSYGLEKIGVEPCARP